MQKKFNNWAFLLVMIVGLFGCGNLKISGLERANLTFGRNVTPIRDIKPTQDSQAKIYVQGKVEKRVPLLQGRVYQVNDSTGSIWVVSKQDNLKEGESAVFGGKVSYESIPIAGQEFGEIYLIEE
jgi:hypothetical protein